MLQPLDQPWINSTCAYCGVGCGIKARQNRKGVLEVEGDKNHPANYGRLCSKGLALGDTVGEQGRLLKPQVDGRTVSWDHALSAVADGFRETVEQYGADSVAFYVSGQLLTEDYYVANKLMKGFIGSANIDTNSRLCMASSVAGHKRAFGSDLVPGCYEDLEQADLLVLVGSNMAWCHPVLFRRIEQAKQNNPDFKLVVVDPRQTDSCASADLHLPLASGSDVALFNGLLSYLAEVGAIEKEYVEQHTSGVDAAVARAVEDTGSIQEVARKTGLASHTVETFFQWFATNKKAVTVYSQGVNQSTQGVDKVNAIINCHLATGRIGQPGAGPFSITGQPNAMGGREVGGLANTLACHMSLEEPLHRKIVSDFWGTSVLPERQGLKAVELFDAISRGAIKAVWIMGTNPVVSLPQADKVKQALLHCPLVVVSDCVSDTDTVRCADIVFPAQGWSEKSGTVTNSERRISRQRNLLIPVGESKPDWWIVSHVAQRMGYEKAFDYRSEADIFREYAAMSAFRNGRGPREALRAFNIGGLSALTDQAYDELSPQQWPVLESIDREVTHKRLFADKRYFTDSGKAHFVPVAHHEPARLTCSEYPLVLNTGRIRDQWHTMTRTGLSARLSGHYPEPFVEVHPDTARQWALEEGRIVRVTSKEGSALVRLKLSDRMQREQVFMPIHWSGVVASEARVDSLIHSDVDRLSGQPELKHTPVSVNPYCFASEAVLAVNQPITALRCDYWVRQTVAGGYVYFLADKKGVPDMAAYLAELTEVAGGEVQVQAFVDSEESCHRRAVWQSDQLIACFWLAETLTGKESEWAEALLGRSLSGQKISTVYREGRLEQERMVCSCKQIGIKVLRQAVKKGADSLCLLKEKTGAGTGCGSCVVEIESLLALESR